MSIACTSASVAMRVNSSSCTKWLAGNRPPVDIPCVTHRLLSYVALDSYSSTRGSLGITNARLVH